MRAVLLESPGAESKVFVGEAPDPVCGADELLVDVAAFALNRGDLAQRKGVYPPPPGASEILGLECAGTVAEVGANVSGWAVGERVMALLPGGGYAERAVVHAGSAMKVPERLSLEEAAAVPEVFLTVFLTVFDLGAFPDGGRLLVHGGGSGIGTAAIQLAKAGRGDGDRDRRQRREVRALPGARGRLRHRLQARGLGGRRERGDRGRRRERGARPHRGAVPGGQPEIARHGRGAWC